VSKVLITTSSFSLGNFSQAKSLHDAGISIEVNPHGRRLSEDEVAELVATDVIAILAGLEPLTDRVLSNAKSLRVIARCGTGLDSVDLQAASRLGIDVFNTPDAPTQAVAELTIAHMLNSLRHISTTDSNMRSGKWTPTMGSLLATKTVGLIGVGRIGSAVAKLAQAFGARVIGFDPVVSSHNSVELLSLDEVLNQADIVSLHVPINDQTHHILNANTISRMKPGSIVVNVSRGGLIDESALHDALKSQHLSGAALDCFEDEPYSGPLLQIPGVHVTAHMGSYARETRDLMEVEASTNLVNGLRKRGLI
jgi:D-3-phosphoglycerate dehydrogenase / 2-oxoglutarate reductase